VSSEPLIILEEASIEDSIVRVGEPGTTDPGRSTGTGIGLAGADEVDTSLLFF
jgi:hypothetical protein